MASTKIAETDQKDYRRIIADCRLHERDVGSSQVQIPRLTERIRHLTEHIKKHPKDKHTRRGLIGMVNRRRTLQRYLKRTDADAHGKIIAALGLRK